MSRRGGYFVADEVVKTLGHTLPGLAAMAVTGGREAVRQGLGSSG
ncbi:MAG TPA: hypothetical protein VMZ51_04675 [Acidimicrobiales bacterium]|nr:hypothetical protein [Acidimicrobiales bacterium]